MLKKKKTFWLHSIQYSFSKLHHAGPEKSGELSYSKQYADKPVSLGFRKR